MENVKHPLSKILSVRSVLLIVVIGMFFLSGSLFIRHSRETQTKTMPPRIETVRTPLQTSVLAATIDVTTYTKPPYSLPAPSGESDIEYTEDIMANLNTVGNNVAAMQDYLLTKYDAKYVDPFLSVVWVGAIEGTLGDPYSWNCLDNADIKINDGCAGGYKSGGWQVGYGIQVSQASSHLVDDFNVAYGEGTAENAAEVQRVGQSVIANSASSSKGEITNPSTFPSKTVSTLVSEANSGSVASQQAVAILLMDSKIGAIGIALEVAADIAGGDNWRGTMEGWPGDYYKKNMQNFSNRMAVIAEKYTGEGGGSDDIPTNNFGAIPPLKLVVRPKTPNSWVVNQAYAKVLGAKNVDNNTGTPADPTGIIPWAEQITAALNPGLWGYLNNQQTTICNDGDEYCANKRTGGSREDLYWCTFLVIDTYNLIGKKGLTPDAHLAVINMMEFWKTTDGYEFLAYNPDDTTGSSNKATLDKVQPGMPFFLANDPTQTIENEHTGLVKNITIDENGNGSLETLESNSDTISHTFPIEAWSVKNMTYALRGFGAIAE